MNRETEAHFSHLPQIDIKRSKFNRPITHKTTFNTGDIIPLYVDADIMGGDSVRINLGAVIRESTPIAPVMDNLYIDVMAFFVPHRLVWQHYEEYWGENKLTAWEPQIKYEKPTINAPATGWEKGSLADYFGIPTEVPGRTEQNPYGLWVNALPGRAYCKIYDDWFRATALQDGVLFNEDETTLTGKNGSDADYDKVTDTQLLAKPLKAGKYHDRFTSATPEPQYGAPVELNILTGDSSQVPVYAGALRSEGWKDDRNPLKWDFYDSTNDKWLEHWDTEANNKYVNLETNTYGGATDAMVNNANNPGVTPYVTPNNLYADLGIVNTAITINELRECIAIQEYLEALARGGNRYISVLRNVFGTISSDARLQRSEYLGGIRRPINMDQVLQTSGTDSEPTPLGNTGAFSMTALRDYLFEHSFEEHGTLMILGIVRQDHTYQQGLHPMWHRIKTVEEYNPYFANLGEQLITNDQIYCQGTDKDLEGFGYQEAWSEYRYGMSYVTGAMRSNYAQSLDIWHYGDYYTSLPQLGDEWIEETQKNVDRTIAVQSDIENQFIADFYFDADYIRPMPVYSVPGIERI